jgi:hypothetical protein
MEINMNMEEIWPIILNALMFYIVFKTGQISARIQQNANDRSAVEQRLAEIRRTGQRPVITIEEINGIYYAYDGNDFLAQGQTPNELGELIAKRFSGKYTLAKVEIKA